MLWILVQRIFVYFMLQFLSMCTSSIILLCTSTYNIHTTWYLHFYICYPVYILPALLCRSGCLVYGSKLGETELVHPDRRRAMHKWCVAGCPLFSDFPSSTSLLSGQEEGKKLQQAMQFFFSWQCTTYIHTHTYIYIYSIVYTHTHTHTHSVVGGFHSFIDLFVGQQDSPFPVRIRVDTLKNIVHINLKWPKGCYSSVYLQH